MHELIFVGDIAIPNDEGRNIHLPDCLKNKEWVVNLEGAITDTLHDDAVYNNTKGFKKLLDAIPIKVASLANNHIFDIDTLDNTISELQKEKILFLGAGKNLEEASRHINFGDFLFLNFGWSVIQCPTATKTKRGTNPYKEEHILKSFEECKLKFPKKKIVLLFHWNYEMELYPMPRQRDLALKLIDLGIQY